MKDKATKLSRVDNYDTLEYRTYTSKSEMDKAINILEGFIEGIAIDGIINEDKRAEFENWYQIHQRILKKHPFSELVSLIEEAFADGYLSSEEKSDILWVCNNYRAENGYYDVITSDIQKLHGLLHGIIADNKVELKEVQQLDEWLSENDHLTGVYPYDELCSLVTVVLQDGKLSVDESNMLKLFFSEFVDKRTSYNLNDYELEELKKNINITGICAVCPDIAFADKTFCFTGVSSKAKRSDIKEIVESLGGIFKNTVTKKTDFLVVGDEGNPCWAFSCYGRKVEQAVNLRKDGYNIMIVHESDFWDEVPD